MEAGTQTWKGASSPLMRVGPGACGRLGPVLWPEERTKRQVCSAQELSEGGTDGRREGGGSGSPEPGLLFPMGSALQGATRTGLFPGIFETYITYRRGLSSCLGEGEGGEAPALALNPQH